MESTVKQTNYRVKGSEKHWSSVGGEKIHRLRADYLSDDELMAAYWKLRPRDGTGFRTYRCQPPGIAA